MKKREEMDLKFMWKPEHIYGSREEIADEFQLLEKAKADIAKFVGKLSEKESLLKALKTSSDAMRRVMKLESYAHRCRDVDVSVGEWQELSGMVESVMTELSAVSSFMEPELLSYDENLLKEFRDNPDFAVFTRYFDALLRNKPHTLSDKEEMIMAQFSGLSFAQYEIFTTFSSIDMKFPKIELDGELVEVNMPTYAKYRGSDNRETRKKIFDAFWGAYDGYKNGISKMLHYQIKYYATASKLRNFQDTLESEMNANELPHSFFYTLRDNIRAILPAFHEYLAVKKEVLNIPDQGYHDVYAKMVTGDSNRKFEYNESVKLINEAMKPMSEEYRSVLAQSMEPENGWVDIYPNKGKVSGAYMSGEAYDSHPFVLLNHIDDYNSASTLAHEMGHAMHSYYSNRFQPFEKSQYTIFVAEVASTFNEIMLINHLLDTTTDKEEKKFLLNHFIEMIRSTVFRQMQFAEFEDEIYKKVERGEALTPDFLSGVYGDTLSRYYGEEYGLMKIEELHKNEWAFVPHFYYKYYVYKYVVGFIGALSLAESVRAGNVSPQQYIDGFLKAGSSKPPLEILKDAGVDMTSIEPYKIIEKVFVEKLKELKELL
ncbi:MAG: oligoendopeptidase F [bacterium]